MAHDVFVSYSAKNKTTADAVCAVLEAEGIRCWIAPRDVDPGAEYGEAIINAIEQARIMVLVFTADANASPQVRREVERAAHHDIAILPVRIENVLPANALAFFIGNVNWLDALTPPLEPHLRKLADTIKRRLEPVSRRKAPAAQPPAAEASQESNRQAPATAPLAASRPAEIHPQEASAVSPPVPQPFEIGKAARLETAERSSTRRSGEWRSRSGTVAAPRAWRVPLWAWGGGAVSALVFVGVFAASHFRAHLGSEASPAPSKPSPATAIGSSGTVEPNGGAAVRKDEAAPPANGFDRETLEDTMRFIQDTLNGIGRVSYVISVVNTDDHSSRKYTNISEISNVIADPNQCLISRHVKDWFNGSTQPREHDYSFKLRDVQSIEVEPAAQFMTDLDATGGEPNLIHSTDPMVTDVNVHERANGDLIDFTDLGLANRVASALRHAAKLCGGAAGGK